MKEIIFEKSVSQFILKSFNKVINKEGYIVEQDEPDQKVLTKDGQNISEDQFAGIRRGSEIFVKSDLPSLIQLLDDLE